MPTLDNAHGLVVGIANYQYVRKLPARVLQDSRDVFKALVDPQSCAYPPQNVTLLQDDEATGAALRAALAALAQKTDGGSTVTIYLSSHGGRIEEGEQRGEYIAPVDARFDQLATTGISGRDFSAALDAIPAAKLLVILDCCHAGGIGEAKSLASEDGLTKGFSQGMYDRLAQGKGRAILASARPDEQSYILPGDENSLFTKHLLAGLRGGVAGEDEFVRVFRLYEYVQPRVTTQHPNQHPRFKANLEDNFPVAFFKGGQKQLAPPAAVTEEEFAYDVYISYAESDADIEWVWEQFIPKLEANGIDRKRIAVSGDVERPGPTLFLEMEKAVLRSKRVLLAFSNDYFDDPRATLAYEMTQNLQVKREEFRLLPVIIRADLDRGRIPERLDLYGPVDVTHPALGTRRLQKVIDELKLPLPTR